jgi:hypothetical protein
MREALIGIGILVTLMALFVFSYGLNNKIKAPEGCENLEDYSGCESCQDHSCMIKARMEAGSLDDRQ